MSGVEWPIPPQRTRVFVRLGRDWRVRKRVSAVWRTAEAQIVMQSTGGQDSRSWSCAWARKRERRLKSEAVFMSSVGGIIY